MTTCYVLLGGFFGQDEPYDELGIYDTLDDLMAAVDGSEPMPHEDFFEYDFYTHKEIKQ